jgi:bifunctional non-homologous end joining protein LigD
MPLQPMLATLADAPMSDPNLVYEPKYDGIRALVSVVPGRRAVEVTIASRLGNDKTAQFPEVVEALEAWGRRRGKPALLDGEIVALDAQRHPVGFQRLQDRIHLSTPQDIGKRTAAAPVALIAFDLLQDGDEDLCRLPLAERRKRLEEALAPNVMAGDALRLAVQVAGDGNALLEEIRATGGEGILVKDRRSPYRPGQRTRDWRKLKLDKRQEFVVGGYTDPRRTRSGFGALLLGLPETDGRLRYTGHVGGGFTEKDLARIKRLLTGLESDECPFVARPPANERPHWIRPQLVVEVRFSNWTDEGYLRHPIFLGLRDDVTPETVRREPDAPVQAPPGPVKVPPEHPFAAVAAALETMGERGSGTLVLADGTKLKFGNLKKPLWPKLGFTKLDLLRYYVAVAPALLPVIKDRPLVMKRLPNGIDAPAFYQHRAPEEVPKGVRAESVRGDDEVPTRFIGGDLATLLHMAQLASISMDPWFSRIQSPDDMDFAAIDLDPMDEAPFSRVRDIARWVRDELATLGVTGWLKTSGASGLHIYLPMRPGTSFETGMLFCQVVATLVSRRHPEAATVERVVKKRDVTSVYIDYLQNVPGKTLACAYSARASEYAGASTPLTWEELDDRLDPRAFTIRTLPERLRRVGDLWAGLRDAPGIDIESVIDRARTRHG